MASAIRSDQGVEEVVTQVPQVFVTQNGESEKYSVDFIEKERSKWINQLVAKFKFLHKSLIDFQSNHLPSLLLVLNSSGSTLDQQSIMNQIQILMDEQRIELKSFELMLSHLGVDPELLYPPVEQSDFGVPSTATATTTYTNRDVQIYSGDGYEHVVNCEGSWNSSNIAAAFLPPQVITSGNFFPDSYSQLMTSNYCYVNGVSNERQELEVGDNFVGSKEDETSVTSVQ